MIHHLTHGNMIKFSPYFFVLFIHDFASYISKNYVIFVCQEHRHQVDRLRMERYRATLSEEEKSVITFLLLDGNYFLKRGHYLNRYVA